MNYFKTYSNFLKDFISLKKPMRVVFDFSNGATGIVAKELFKKRDDITPLFLNSEPDQDFKAHGPNPLAHRATSELSKKIREKKADMGVAFDADGDRAIILDNKGRILPPHIVALLLFEESKPPFVVDELVFKSLEHTNLLTKGMHASKIGTLYIKNKMREKKAEVGAEYSGHYYFKKFFYSDSGLLAAILAMNTASNMTFPLARFWDNSPPHTVINKNIKMDERKIDSMETKLMTKFSKSRNKVRIEKREGVTLDFGTEWVNIRKSNTEPLVRLVAGARNRKDSLATIEKIKKVIEK